MDPEITAINTHKRLFDLVRYSRGSLHEEGLITDEEYAWLCSEAPLAKGRGSPSPRRLEDYDELIAKSRRMEKALEEIRDLVPGESDDPERDMVLMQDLATNALTD